MTLMMITMITIPKYMLFCGKLIYALEGGDWWYHSGTVPNGTNKTTMIAITGIQH